MSQSRGKKLQALTQPEIENVFYMSLDEAKKAIASKYDYFAESYERRFAKRAKAG